MNDKLPTRFFLLIAGLSFLLISCTLTALLRSSWNIWWCQYYAITSSDEQGDPAQLRPNGKSIQSENPSDPICPPSGISDLLPPFRGLIAVGLTHSLKTVGNIFLWLKSFFFFFLNSSSGGPGLPTKSRLWRPAIISWCLRAVMAQMWTSEPRNVNHLPGKIIMVRMANQIHGAIFHIGRCCLMFTLRGFHWKWMSSSEIRHEIVHWIVREGRWRNIGRDLATCNDSGGAIWFSRSEGLSADDGRYPGRNVGSASLSLCVRFAQSVACQTQKGPYSPLGS